MDSSICTSTAYEDCKTLYVFDFDVGVILNDSILNHHIMMWSDPMEETRILVTFQKLGQRGQQ